MAHSVCYVFHYHFPFPFPFQHGNGTKISIFVIFRYFLKIHTQECIKKRKKHDSLGIYSYFHHFQEKSYCACANLGPEYIYSRLSSLQLSCCSELVEEGSLYFSFSHFGNLISKLYFHFLLYY